MQLESKLLESRMQGKHDEYEARMKAMFDLLARFRANDVGERTVKPPKRDVKTVIPHSTKEEVKDGQKNEGGGGGWSSKRYKREFDTSKFGKEGRDGDRK